MSAGVFAAVFAAMIAGHQVGDYWVQRSWQAAGKGEPGWRGRGACAAHAATHALAVLAFVTAAWIWLRLPLSVPWVDGGIFLNAATHYFADRRTPLRKLADRLGSGQFYRTGEGLATGAALLDQAWHWGWLFVSALIVSGHR